MWRGRGGRHRGSRGLDNFDAAVVMNDRDRDIEQILADKGKIEAALRAAVRKALGSCSISRRAIL